MDEYSTSWETYEQVATYVLNRIANRFGVDHFKSKQNVLGVRSGTTYKLDAKGIVENAETFLIVECRRYTHQRQNQEKLSAIAYRIMDTGAKGGIVVSLCGLQKGASKIAASENIHSVILEEGSTFEHYVVTLLNETIIKPAAATVRCDTLGPTVTISDHDNSTG